MNNLSSSENQIQYVSNFQELVSKPFHGIVNANCWKRQLEGDFSEIVEKLDFHGNMIEVKSSDLMKLTLSREGEIAREVILNDLKLLKSHGADPILNLINHYERDDVVPSFPTDVYSYHVDRSPVPTDTFLCTYFGDSSDILPNAQAEQKILVPEIRQKLLKLHGGKEAGFDSFLTEFFFDLHYQEKPKAQPINLGVGHLWRLAVDHPESVVPPCVHRAPEEKSGYLRLLLIC
jgi:hypothetical protein